MGRLEGAVGLGQLPSEADDEEEEMYVGEEEAGTRHRANHSGDAAVAPVFPPPSESSGPHMVPHTFSGST